MNDISATLFAQAQSVIPGGVNSPVRAFNSVGGDPVFVTSGSGCRMTTADGQELIDFCGSWGPLIMGHAHPKILETVNAAAAKGLTFGVNTPGEVELAELICELAPVIEKVRLVNSGTEATMTALRIARGATNRQKIVKFDGCYHGHSDGLLVAAGSGLLTGGISNSAGVTDETAANVFVLPYNDPDAVRTLFAERGSEIAAIIVEPIAGNMGLIEPVPGFLESLRECCDASGSVLIFDEVITGFRLAPTTYGCIRGMKPDLTCLGKIIGGGMPIGAVGGKKELMDLLSPVGCVYQAGTLSGNPVAVATGICTLNMLRDENPYPEIARLATKVETAFNEMGKGNGFNCVRIGSMFTVFFRDEAPVRLDEVKTCDTDRFATYHRSMLNKGFYLPPSQFEANFVGAAHSDAEIDALIDTASKILG